MIKHRWYKTIRVNGKKINTTLTVRSKELVKWNKEKIGNVAEAIKITRVKLEAIRSKNPARKFISKELGLSKKLEEYSLQHFTHSATNFFVAKDHKNVGEGIYR